MIDNQSVEKIINDLKLIYHYTHGAHSATHDEESGATYHQICHKLDEVINYLKINKSKPTIGLFENDVQNQIHQDMMEEINNRLERIERFLNLMGDE